MPVKDESLGHKGSFGPQGTAPAVICIVPRMRVAVAQFAASLDKAANLDQISALSEAAARDRARLVVLPEAAMCDFGHPKDDLHTPAEPVAGPFTEALRKLAASHQQVIVAGMFESIPGDPRVFNTAVVVDGRGVIAAYRKRHLFDALGDLESTRIRSGPDDPPIVEVDGFKVGVAICYDMRFASFIGGIADRGAGLLVVPAAWVSGPLKEDHWTVLVRARAMDSTMYVAAAGQTGSHYSASSAIVDPLGVVVARLGEAPGVATADISIERLDSVRAELPLLTQRARRPAAAPASS